jgi:3-dehydroquinate dehydratase II
VFLLRALAPLWQLGLGVKMNKILIINGPNLNLLGEREPEIYGFLTLEDISNKIKEYIKNKDIEVKFFQSNHEGQIIDFIHEHRKWADGILINPAALTHYSYSLRDAISSVAVPTVEVHLSDISKRETFRQNSVIKDVCIQQVSGLGLGSYLKGLDILLNQTTQR